LAGAAGFLVGELGRALGISRKHSIPLLEHLDSVHFTRRVGDRRVLARGAPGRPRSDAVNPVGNRRCHRRRAAGRKVETVNRSLTLSDKGLW
ncbi:MAG TPA: SelB C-terminal domain-containing protein, partial [Geminicoccaceae bacterium]|nr:SelB C-terminal domain-containing protein [Geminicoccaceae bacterium]